MADEGTLLVLQTYNIAFDSAIFPLEQHRVNLSVCYNFLACTGARPAEIVHNERNMPKDGSFQELWDPKAVLARSQMWRDRADSSDNDAPMEKPEDIRALCEGYEDEPPDENYRLLEELLSQETVGRGRPKALCYEDILLSRLPPQIATLYTKLTTFKHT